MEFANPAALWLLPLALLVLLIRRRPPARRVAVATLHLWEAAAPRDVSPWARHLRRHWLVYVQMAFILAAVLGMAGPGRRAGARQVAMVLDDSLSMSARSDGASRFDLARQRAGAALDAMARGTRVRLIAAAGAPRDLGEFDAGGEALREALAAMRPTDAAAGIDAAVDFAESTTPAPGRVVVLTDAPASDRAGVEWVTVGRPQDNVAIVAVSARRERSHPSDALVLVQLWNYGASPVTATLALTRENALLARRPVALAPRSGASVVETFENFAGIVSASLDADDAIAADNARSVAVPPPLRTIVSLVGRNAFVERALRSRAGVVLLPGAGSSPTPGAGAVGTDPVDIVVCAACDTAPGNGRAVLLIARAPAQPEAEALLSAVERRHALTRAAVFDGVGAVPVPGRVLVAGDDVVVKAGAMPALVAYEAGGRRIVELRIDLDRSTLPLTPAFPVLMANILDWLAGSDRAPDAYVAGALVERAIADGDITTAPVVTGPGDQTVTAVVSGGRLSLSDTRQAGLYHVRGGGAGDAFVINPAVEDESDTASPPRVPDRAPAGGTPGGATDRRADLTGAVLAGALALLALEWSVRLRAQPSARRPVAMKGPS